MRAGGTEIERAAVGGEDGEGLVNGVLLEQWRQQQIVALHVIDLQVGGGVEDLDAVPARAVEQLVRGVGGIGDVASRRVPVGIDTETEGLVGLSVVGGDGSVVLPQQRGTVRSADMQAHVLGIGAVEAVAVDAALELGVLDQRPLLEGGQVALVDAHLAPHLIAGLYQAVAEAVVDAVGTDIDGKRTVGMPAVFVFRRNHNAERVPAVLGEQLVPLVDIEVRRLLALGMQAVPVFICDDGIDLPC